MICKNNKIYTLSKTLVTKIIANAVNICAFQFYAIKHSRGMSLHSKLHT